MITTESMTAEMQTCIEISTDCQKICLETLNYYKGSKNVDMNLMCMIRDCAEMSTMCINMIVDGSEFMGRTCEICAEMCDRLSAACERMRMEEIAIACRKCAESCKTMARMSVSYFRRSNFVTEETLLNY
jgi:hypothetical protein